MAIPATRGDATPTPASGVSEEGFFSDQHQVRLLYPQGCEIPSVGCRDA